jgi:putative monooxygenase
MTPGKGSLVQPAILRSAEIEARSRGGGVRTIPLVTRKVGAASLINGITIFDPGAAVPLHSHNCEESVVILSGRALVEIDGVEHEVGPEDATFLPANIPHRFKNASQTEGLRILWTYASIDATRTNIETGQTRSIDDEHITPSTA